MDTLTQIALGATIADGGYGKSLGRRGILFGGFCGLFPDLDVLLTIGNPWGSLLYHRAHTHSIILLPIAAIVLGYLAWRLIGDSEAVRPWISLAFWALMTHPLLDLCTMYGTQIFAPFSTHRFAIDAISIVDPLYSVPLFAVVGVSLWGDVKKGRCQYWSRVALVSTTLYIGAGFVQSQWAMHRAESQLHKDGFEITKIRAVPTLLNNLVHRIVAKNKQGDVAVGFTSSLASATPIDFKMFEWPTEKTSVQRVMGSKKGQIFEWFADGFLRAKIDSREGRRVVTLVDVKYGGFRGFSQSVFSAFFEIRDEAIQKAELKQSADFEISEEFEALWNRLLGRPVD